eukprot:m.100500 g.100500  ORF g.100500 m.100500 type:complete len:486 (-) comp13709_c0_seq5:32-1489(-)
MDVEVSFVNEDGQPIPFPEWPGDVECPQQHKTLPNRYIYTHDLMKRKGFSLSRADRISNLKKMLVGCTPHLQPGLAAGRQINRVFFCGKEMGDDFPLTEEVTVKHGRFEGAGLERIWTVEMVTEITLTLLDNRTVSLVFDDFPEASIHVGDIKEVVAEGLGMAITDLHMIRTYPTIRPSVFKDSDLLLGFPGKLSKGLWEIPPYPGPIRPAAIPTPPDMKFKMVPSDVVKALRLEDDLWEALNIQHEWRGHCQEHCGEASKIAFNFGRPESASFIKIETDVDSKIIHSQLKEDVKLAGRVACSPDKSYLKGLCSIRPHVKVYSVMEDMYGCNLYLPSRELIAKEGKEYVKYEKGTSYGDGTVNVPELGSFPIRFRLRLNTTEDSIMAHLTAVGFAKLTKDGPKTEHVWDGVIQKGVTQVLSWRGQYWTVPHFEGVQVNEVCMSIMTKNIIYLAVLLHHNISIYLSCHFATNIVTFCHYGDAPLIF